MQHFSANTADPGLSMCGHTENIPDFPWGHATVFTLLSLISRTVRLVDVICLRFTQTVYELSL